MSNESGPSRRARLRWWLAGALVFLTVLTLVFRGWNGADATTRTTGIPAAGRTIPLGLLATELPPPPRDALHYQVRTPLHNSDQVVKNRWLWAPEGKHITITKSQDGVVHFDVPIGTMWWKEFALTTSRGTRLIERRIVARVPHSMDPSGWKLYTASTDVTALVDHEPTDLNRYRVDTEDPAFQSMTYSHDQWMPTQDRGPMVEVDFDSDGTDVPYVYPGHDNCVACHGGAPGAYPGAAADPIKAFGLHPRNLTLASLVKEERRGWIVGDDLVFNAVELAALKRERADLPADAPRQSDALTSELVGLLRNNCASCHNSQPASMGSPTAFHLDPNLDYTRTQLAKVLEVKGKMMGDQTLHLVQPGDPDRSEIMLRLQGLEGRRRMPPIEGGVPEPYQHLIDVMRRWISSLPKEAS